MLKHIKDPEFTKWATQTVLSLLVDEADNKEPVGVDPYFYDQKQKMRDALPAGSMVEILNDQVTVVSPDCGTRIKYAL